MNGIINVLKPPMMTSGSVVAAVKRMTGCAHVGHTGTLDPNAAGVLPIVVGRYTKLAEYFLADEKEYIGEILFGTETDSCDTEGNVVATSGIIPTDEQIKNILPEFCGDIVQYPPAYSAIKINGKKAYELARENKEVEIPSRNVNIKSIEFLRRIDYNRVTIRVKCSKGTYIRSLARDIGKKLNSCACLSMLVRTKHGDFEIENACTLENVEQMLKNNNFDELFVDVNDALSHMPRAVYSKNFEKRLICGNFVKIKDALYFDKNADCNAIFRVLTDSELICLAKLEVDENNNRVLQPIKVIAQ